MPERKTLKRARKAKREGKSPTTQAGEFVHEEIEHIREGKHGARSAKQAIAIGLSKARRAGVKLPPPKRGQASAGTRKTAARDYQRGQKSRKPTTSAKRARASTRALEARAAPHGVAAGALEAGAQRGAPSPPARELRRTFHEQHVASTSAYFLLLPPTSMWRSTDRPCGATPSR